MRNDYPYLKDSSFLKQLDQERNKEQYVRITVLTFDEKPIQSIEGRVTGGTLNLDGSSSVRRTCNLSLVAFDYENDLTNVNNLLSINKKVELEVGFLNKTNYYTNYDIIWFPLGVYVIMAPSISHGTDSTSISLQLKDKMCLLNGDCGGVLPASVTFSEYEALDENGQYVILKPTIYQIIKELVNHYGGEQLSKIIISDVDTRVKQVMKWVGSTPFYITENAVGGSIQYTPTTDAVEAASAQSYKKFEYGEDIGYIYTDFTYPEDLIGNAGDSVCTILDKIKNTLGNYEYYYDINGNFVFQEIKNYLNTSQATVELDKMTKDDYLMDMSKGKAVYEFDDCSLFTSCSNSPQYNMIKNDFIVWGIREAADGKTYPIRYHLAIDQKPATGNEYSVYFYTDSEDNLIKAKVPLEFKKKSDLPKTGAQDTLYLVMDEGIVYIWDVTSKAYKETIMDISRVKTSDWRSELYLQGSVAEPLGTDSNYYYTELSNEWPKLYDVQNGAFYDEVLKSPSDIDYYLDFIDSNSSIMELSVSNIGRRSKVINDNSINCIFAPEIPNLVLLNMEDENIAEEREECENQGQDYIQLSGNLFSMISGGGSANSAYDMVRELLYQYTSYNESISINSIPIFYLEPNIRITVRDAQSGIYGDYMIKSMSIPFDVSGTMTISCTRALERI